MSDGTLCRAALCRREREAYKPFVWSGNEDSEVSGPTRRRRSLCFNMDGNGKPFSSDITVCLSETITFLRWLLLWLDECQSERGQRLDTECQYRSIYLVSAFRNIIIVFFGASSSPLSDLPILWRVSLFALAKWFKQG